MRLIDQSIQGKRTVWKCYYSPPQKKMGVWIDDKLKFTNHIGHTVAKSNQILGLIERSFVCSNSKIIKRLFIALVRPHLEYANSLWQPRFKKDVEQIEKVQRFATKLVTSLRHMLYQNDYKLWNYHPWFIVDTEVI